AGAGHEHRGHLGQRVRRGLLAAVRLGAHRAGARALPDHLRGAGPGPPPAHAAEPYGGQGMSRGTRALYRRRRTADAFVRAAAVFATVFGLFWLGWILLTILGHGLAGLRLATFAAPTPPPGVEGGGLANAIMGSLLILGVAVALGAPLGVLTGTFLAE